MHRQLVYPMPLVVQLLECLQHDPRLSDAREPLPHAETHQDGGSDEIDVTNLSGVLANAQKVAVRDEGNLVGIRTELNFTGLGVTASADPVDERRVNVTVRSVTVLDDNATVSAIVQPNSSIHFLG